jgi:hypothetical protein
MQRTEMLLSSPRLGATERPCRLDPEILYSYSACSRDARAKSAGHASRSPGAATRRRSLSLTNARSHGFMIEASYSMYLKTRCSNPQ